MRWYEYKMEVDDLHAPDDLKARLMAMQAAETAAQPAPEPAAPAPEKKKKKPIRFPLRGLGSIAACAAVCLLGYGALSVTHIGIGAAKSSDTSVQYSAASMAASRSASYDAPEAAAFGTYSLTDSNGAEPVTLSADDAARSVDNTTKIIYTANLSLESKDYDNAFAALETAISDAGGYMESSSEYSDPSSSRSVSLTLRIPQENYDSFLAAAAQVGNLTSKNQQAEDVTAQYMDLETRLSTLEAQRTRLLELQAQADNLSDLLEIESSLNDVQYQIESWQSQLDWYSDQVECCTVYVNLYEVKDYTTTSESFVDRLTAAFGNGWSAFISGAQQLAVWLIYVWPVILLLAALAVIGLLWHKRRANRK